MFENDYNSNDFHSNDFYSDDGSDSSAQDSPRQSRSYSGAMATAALIFSAIAIPTSIICYISIPLASLAILLALLARGSGPITGRIRLTILAGAMAICMSATFTYNLIHMFLTDQVFQNQIKTMWEFYTGEPWDEYWSDLRSAPADNSTSPSPDWIASLPSEPDSPSWTMGGEWI